jgi:hypothetical protein
MLRSFDIACSGGSATTVGIEPGGIILLGGGGLGGTGVGGGSGIVTGEVGMRSATTVFKLFSTRGLSVGTVLKPCGGEDDSF